MHGLQACCCCCIPNLCINVVKMLLKGEVGGHALNSHGNYIVDHGKSWKNHRIVFLNICGNLGQGMKWINSTYCSGFLMVESAPTAPMVQNITLRG